MDIGQEAYSKDKSGFSILTSPLTYQVLQNLSLKTALCCEYCMLDKDDFQRKLKCHHSVMVLIQIFMLKLLCTLKRSQIKKR